MSSPIDNTTTPSVLDDIAALNSPSSDNDEQARVQALFDKLSEEMGEDPKAAFKREIEASLVQNGFTDDELAQQSARIDQAVDNIFRELANATEETAPMLPFIMAQELMPIIMEHTMGAEGGEEAERIQKQKDYLIQFSSIFVDRMLSEENLDEMRQEVRQQLLAESPEMPPELIDQFIDAMLQMMLPAKDMVIAAQVDEMLEEIDANQLDDLVEAWNALPESAREQLLHLLRTFEGELDDAALVDEDVASLLVEKLASSEFVLTEDELSEIDEEYQETLSSILQIYGAVRNALDEDGQAKLQDWAIQHFSLAL